LPSFSLNFFRLPNFILGLRRVQNQAAVTAESDKKLTTEEKDAALSVDARVTSRRIARRGEAEAVVAATTPVAADGPTAVIVSDPVVVTTDAPTAEVAATTADQEHQTAVTAIASATRRTAAPADEA
jgi:hypothetical protein